MRRAALVGERLFARLPLTPPLGILCAHPVLEGVLLVPKRVHVLLRGRLGVHRRYLCVPPYYLHRVVLVDIFLNLPHQLILSLVKLEGPLKRCARAALLSPQVERCERPGKLLRQCEYLLV
jgi:hypothetical protein